MISPYSKVNAVDHTPTEQTSVLKFIEDNWHTGRLGDASFDERAGSLAGMFDFRHPNGKQVLLNKDGSVKSVGKIRPVAPVAASIDRGAAAPNLSETADSVPTLPIGIAAGALAVGATGTLLAVRRRRTRHTAA